MPIRISSATRCGISLPAGRSQGRSGFGHAKVGNIRNWVTKFQSLEYTCGFNLDRRAYDKINAITVVPGAISAFRKSAIEDCGGFAFDTLAEDTDLTSACIGAAGA